MVAKTASIVTGGGQYYTNRLTKHLRLILQIGVRFKGHLFIYLALAKPALPGQFDLLVSSQSKEKVEPKQSIPQQHGQKGNNLNISPSLSSTE
jgi:hypothetical protein